MLAKRKWNVVNKFKVQPPVGGSKFKVDDINDILLENRGIKTKKEKENFLNPKLEEVTIESVGIDKKELNKTLKRIENAIGDKEAIVVFGDYDVDGITGTAILWETLYALGANVVPYIPHRVDEGYGLSIRGIENLKSQTPNVSLIITVDNGIVANEAVDFANKQGIDVIVTDHHIPSAGGKEKSPNAFSIVHTTKLCGAGVAWILSQEISNKSEIQHTYLDLVALATVADLVPLTGANRTLLKIGLPYLRQTKRIGLKALFEEAGIDPQVIGVYEIGHIIGPRLNAMGRMESAMDSLRLLCTKNLKRAYELAHTLGQTNRERQLITQAASLHAIESVRGKASSFKNILFIANEGYEEGIIGLVAGKLVEKFYRPSIVISKKEKISKASARSIAGFNIIEFIRSSSHLLINAGGHPMAAGFTIETEKIVLLQEAMEKLAEELIVDDLLIPIINIDCELPLSLVSQELYDAIQTLSPFGMANPEPTFISKQVEVVDIRVIGKDKTHLKLSLRHSQLDLGFSLSFDAIAFGMAELSQKIKIGNKIDIVYTINENVWNGSKKLQLKIKDINYY